MSSGRPDRGAPDEADDRELTPEEEAAWQAGLERLQAEKRRALLEPGPSWREWFFYDHAKWWVGLGFLIGNVWLVATWFPFGAVSPVAEVGAPLSIAAAVYLELLLWRYLWRRPADEGSTGRRRFRPSWTTLREVGRWTPEEARRRAGQGRAAPDDGAPNPREFL